MKIRAVTATPATAGTSGNSNYCKRAFSAATLILTLACGLLLAAAAAPIARAQSAAGPIAPAPDQALQTSPQLEPNIRVGVNLVSTPAIARDAKGNLLEDLTAQNFRIFDNGVEQKIESFDTGGGPLSIVLVIENSARVESLLPAIRRLGVQFTQTVMGAEGDAAVVVFNDDVDTLSEFTGNPDAIEKTLTQLPEGTAGSRLYDGMSRGVDMLRGRTDTRRRVLITMAEAVDTGSEARLGDILRRAQLSNITIYSIGLSTAAAESKGNPEPRRTASATPPGTFSLPPMPGTPQTPGTEDVRTGSGADNLDLDALVALLVQNIGQKVQRPLEVAAFATGGMYQSTGFKDSTISTSLDQISAELHGQYVLSYRPTGTGGGDYHQIRVEIVGRRGVKVRTRPGYYMAAQTAQN